MMKTILSELAARISFRRQIILAFVAVFFVLTTAFSAYQVVTERTYLYRSSTNDTINLAQALAASSRSWVLAYDLNGMQEVVHSFQSNNELRYAMIVSPSGRVLAHTDATKIGQFVSDEASLALIHSPPGNRIMIDNETLSDIAAPIMMEQRHIGWARVAHGREGIADNLRNMILASVSFVLLATGLSLLAALFIANRLGYRIRNLVRVAEKVQAGNYATRANPSGADEIATLADSFNHMLDVLAQDEERLRAVSLYTRSLIEASLDPLVTINAQGKITDVNAATEKATGRSREELIGTDFSDYFTEPDQAREGYQQVFNEGSVTDYPLSIRHRDGHVTDVLYNASVYRNEAGEALGVFAAARDVTERKQAEEELRLSELRNRLLFENSRDALMMLAPPSWKFTGANQATLKLFGAASVAEFTALGPWDVSPELQPDGRPSSEKSQEMIATAMREGSSYFEWEHRRLGGQPFAAEVLLTRMTLGEEVFLQASVRDITGRKKAEVALRESEAALKEAQRLAHVGSWHIDLATNEVVWSEVLYQMYGFDPALPPPLYTESMKLFTPESWERLSTSIARAVESGISYELELEMMPKGGGRKWMLARGELVRDEQGAPVRVRGVVMDITKRKQADEQLRRSAHSLSEAQRIAHLGSWELDLVSNVLVWSDEIYRIFEIDPEKFGASYEAFLNAIHPDDREPVNKAYTDSVRDKVPYNIAHRLKMPDGRIKYVNENCETYYGKDDKPLRSVGTVHDITELKQAEDRIVELNRDLERRVAARTAELEAANKELEAFSYSVSHDLRTPLRAIDGFSSILLEDYRGKLDDEGKRLLDVVRDNAGKMGQLIDDILKFSRAGRLEMTLAEIDMEKMAHEVSSELLLAVDESKWQLEIEPLPSAHGDRAMMRQVLVNLLSNAIKFSGKRNPARIRVGSYIEGNETVYYVKDNGAGFDMRFVDKLFGVFQRLHGVTEFEGTGIGLAIVKRIIARHGGRVWAEGKVDEGATLYFALPTGEMKHE